jgi:hypothetical protein
MIDRTSTFGFIGTVAATAAARLPDACFEGGPV